ncbi:MAG: DMT family transporter [Betaproteobacteria bacterium]|nr:MAG: DMT family transporter [Betaproteobacteria bacterium]
MPRNSVAPSEAPFSATRRLNRKAILLMFCALSLLICLDASGKFLGQQGVPVAASVWSRYLGHVVVAALMFVPQLGWGAFRPANPTLQWARGGLMLLVTLFYFGALKYLPLAEATSLFFLTPILTTLLAAWWLREYPSRITIMAIALGFVGVLIVARPGTGLASFGVMLVVCAAICNALYQTLTRVASVSTTRVESAGTQLIYSGLVGAVIMSLAMPFWWSWDWWQAAETSTRIVFIAMGVLGALGHWLLIRAYSLVAAMVLTPWMYMQLALSVLLGWLIFGAVPDGLTLLGIAVIATAPQLTRIERRAAPV